MRTSTFGKRKSSPACSRNSTCLWTRSKPSCTTLSPEDLKPWLDKLGVSQTVVVQVNATLANTRYFLDLADKNSWIGGVVGWVDLADPAVGETLDQIKHPKLVAFRHQWHDEADAAWNVRPDVVRGLRELAKRGLRYDLLVKQREWKYIVPVADAVPDLPLVIDHIAKPSIANQQFDDWAEAMKVGGQHPAHAHQDLGHGDRSRRQLEAEGPQAVRGQGARAVRHRAGHVRQ